MYAGREGGRMIYFPLEIQNVNRLLIGAMCVEKGALAVVYSFSAKTEHGLF